MHRRVTVLVRSGDRVARRFCGAVISAVFLFLPASSTQPTPFFHPTSRSTSDCVANASVTDCTRRFTVALLCCKAQRRASTIALRSFDTRVHIMCSPKIVMTDYAVMATRASASAPCVGARSKAWEGYYLSIATATAKGIGPAVGPLFCVWYGTGAWPTKADTVPERAEPLARVVSLLRISGGKRGLAVATPQRPSSLPRALVLVLVAVCPARSVLFAGIRTAV